MSICFRIQKFLSVFKLLFALSSFLRSGRTLTAQFKINATAKTSKSIKNLFVQLSVGSRKKDKSLFLCFNGESPLFFVFQVKKISYSTAYPIGFTQTHQSWTVTPSPFLWMEVIYHSSPLISRTCRNMSKYGTWSTLFAMLYMHSVNPTPHGRAPTIVHTKRYNVVEKKREEKHGMAFCLFKINSWWNSSFAFLYSFGARPPPTHTNHRELVHVKAHLLFRYRYTWNGKNSQYPMIRTIRYPRYNTPNPSVTCFVVNLNVLKYINLIPLTLPDHLDGDFYIGNMFWISNHELTLTYTSRDQTLSSTVLCKAPLFECVEVSGIRNMVLF